MPLRIGTSGWSYDDWEGPVYPASVEPADRLRYYAVAFPTVEIDSTFYRDPLPDVVRGWVAKAADAPGFEFSLKAPQSLTQEALAREAPSACAAMARDWAYRVVGPLEEARRLGVVLLQLSPGIVASRESVARLDAVLGALAPLPLAVEFRNRTWHDQAGARLRPYAVELLDRHGAAAVVVDGPPFPAIVEGSAEHAYVRFHGRNRDVWFARDKAALGERHDRYDYTYPRAELEPWAPTLGELARRKREVRVYFNNHYAGQAWRNAGEMMELLASAGAPVVRARSAQRRLGV